MNAPHAARAAPIATGWWYLALTAAATILYVLRQRHSAFEWTTTQDIPYLLRLLDPTWLPHDFYTNSVAGSPRLLFNALVAGMTALGLDWYSALYLLKVFYHVATPLLIFSALAAIARRWLDRQPPALQQDVLHGAMALMAVGGLSWLQGTYAGQGPGGWGAAQAEGSISPMSLGLMAALLYLRVRLAAAPIRGVAPAILAVTALLHPAIALCALAMGMIFYLPMQRLALPNGREWVPVDVIATFVPLIVIAALWGSSSGDSERFVEQYVHLRHPHHYLMSHAVGTPTVLWGGMFATLIAVALWLREARTLILAVLAPVALGGAIVLQFVGTELLASERIAEAGPSRFTSFTSLIFGGLVVAIAARLMARLDPHWALPQRAEALYAAIPLIGWLRHGPRNPLAMIAIAVLVAVVGVFATTLNDPLADYADGEGARTMQWLRENTSPDSVIFQRGIDANLIRVYAERSVFVDKAFPFNKQDANEYTRRLSLWLNAAQFEPQDFRCMAEHNNIGYLLISNAMLGAMETAAPAWRGEIWSIFETATLPVNSRCDAEQLEVWQARTPRQLLAALAAM